VQLLCNNAVRAGNLHVVEVLQHVFQYIDLLRTPAGVTQALYDDNAALRKLAFNFQNQPEAFAYTSHLAHCMHSYPLQHLLQAASAVPLKYDEAAIRAELHALTVDDLVCMWVSHDHVDEGMETERWCAFASCNNCIVCGIGHCLRSGGDALSTAESRKLLVLFPG
jgi:secreted Zn-dependent insulinase-like peptidase